ncbi:MAG: twin-arginine translocase TatA/TatE family subunit [Solirubrobacterales bacterium]
MPNIGVPEIAIVLIIALIVFGPKRLPELGKSLGSGMREFKSSITGEKSDDPPQIDNGVEEPPVEAEPTSVAAAQADTEAQTATPAPADQRPS